MRVKVLSLALVCDATTLFFVMMKLEKGSCLYIPHYHTINTTCICRCIVYIVCKDEEIPLRLLKHG